MSYLVSFYKNPEKRVLKRVLLEGNNLKVIALTLSKNLEKYEWFIKRLEPHYHTQILKRFSLKEENKLVLSMREEGLYFDYGSLNNNWVWNPTYLEILKSLSQGGYKTDIGLCWQVKDYSKPLTNRKITVLKMPI